MLHRGRMSLEVDQLRMVNLLLSGLSASQNSFYQRKLGGLSKVGDLSEFSEKVPFTRKAELAADQNDHPPYGTNLSRPLINYM